MQARSITVPELRAVTALLLDAIERREGADIDLNVDFYWHLPVESAFDMTAEPGPTALTVGQLLDDVTELRDALSRPNEIDLAPWHELNHLIGVLRALEHRLLP